MCWAVHLGRDCDQPEKEQAMTDAMTDVTDERLAELIYLREQMIKISGGDSFDGLDTLDAFRELQRRRASDRWIPWSVGDVLPADGLYWVTFDKNFGVAMCDARVPRLFLFDSVTAYWSRPLPDPFDSSMGAEHG
jgi:hypothetical protein